MFQQNSPVRKQSGKMGKGTVHIPHSSAHASCAPRCADHTPSSPGSESRDLRHPAKTYLLTKSPGPQAKDLKCDHFRPQVVLLFSQIGAP